MKKNFLILSFIFLFLSTIQAENFNLYTGSTSDQIKYSGISLGGNIIDFLNMQIDVFKYLDKDDALHSNIKEENRDDFLGLSVNFTLVLPIYLIPKLDRLDFIQPYFLAGYGYGIENLTSDYYDVEDINGKKGFFSKLRSFSSLGYGVIIMISGGIGIKLDYRSVKISEHSGMLFPGRKFNRFSVGVCFGSSKKSLKKVK